MQSAFRSLIWMQPRLTSQLFRLGLRDVMLSPSPPLIDSAVLYHEPRSVDAGLQSKDFLTSGQPLPTVKAI